MGIKRFLLQVWVGVFLGAFCGAAFATTDPPPDTHFLLEVQPTQNHGYQRFGTSSSPVGDVNNDGYEDLAIGAPQETAEFNGDTMTAGAVYVYSGRDGSFIYKVVGDEPGGEFGTAILPAGDLDNDGYDDFFVSAPYGGLLTLNHTTGNVRIVDGATGAFFPCVISDLNAFSDGFGQEMAGGVDLNQSGNTDLLVAAPRAWSLPRGVNPPGTTNGAGGGTQPSSFLPEAGMVYWIDILNPNSGQILSWGDPNPTWGCYRIRAKLGGRTAGEHFGSSLTLVGNIDPINGQTIDFAVGAPDSRYRCQPTDEGCGYAEVYAIPPAYLPVSFPPMPYGAPMQHPIVFADSYCGTEVSGVGDVNGDGYLDLAVACPREISGGFNPSRIYIVSLFVTPLTNLLTPLYIISTSHHERDPVIVGLPDLNQNGKAEVLVGRGFNSRVDIFEANDPPGWEVEMDQVKTSPAPQWVSSGFGESISVVGNFLALGAPGFNSGVGIASIFYLPDWLKVP